MSKGNGTKADKPEFDFTQVSRKWNKAFFASIAKAARAQVAMQRQSPDDPALLDAHLDRLEQAIVDLEQISDEQAALVCLVLKSVPAGWLLSGAPADLDWHEVDSLEWIQADKYTEILTMLQGSRALAEGEAKN